jgi:hypothetical protein
MHPVNPNAMGSSSRILRAQNNRDEAAIASGLSRKLPIGFQAARRKWF